MNDLSIILVALFTLAIIAVLASSKQTPTFITGAGQFLVSMVGKVNSA